MSSKLWDINGQVELLNNLQVWINDQIINTMHSTPLHKMVRMVLLSLILLLLLPDTNCQEVSGQLLSLIRPETLAANRWRGGFKSQITINPNPKQHRQFVFYTICLLFEFLMTEDCREPPSDQVLQLMRTFLTWKENYDPRQDRNCLIVNFGVRGLRFPTLRFISFPLRDSVYFFPFSLTENDTPSLR